jgi:UDP-N-acetylmuramate dehydrogenase
MVEIRTVEAKELSSLNVGGIVAHMSVSTDEELLYALSYAESNGKKVHIHGEGTNTFFGDKLDNLLIISIAYKGITVEDHLSLVRVKCGGGEVWDDVVKYAVEREWWGIENLSLIPGTAGAAPVQNIGAYGAELSSVCESVRVYDTVEKKFSTFCKSACQFGYRDSIFKRSNGRYIITEILLILSKLPKPNVTYRPLDTLKEKENVSIQDIRDLVVATRNSKLPDYHTYPNCGSFFKNPTINENTFIHLQAKYPNVVYFKDSDGYKIPAGWLIEYVATMKGERVGDVGIWKDQALVVVNYKDATADEILTFTNDIIYKVEHETGITLEREVQFVGGF